MYNFKINLEIFNIEGRKVFSQDVTGEKLSTIKGAINANSGEGFSGGLTGSLDGETLDGASLASVKAYDLNSFTDFLLSCQSQVEAIQAGETALMYFLA